MGGGSSNASSISQNSTNNLLQNNKNACQQNATAISSGNVTIVSGSSIGGSVVGSFQDINTDFTCNITSNMEQTVQSILQSITKQTSQSQNDLLGGIQVATNKINVAQSMVNNMAQINQSLCTSDSIVSQTNNFTYVSNSAVGGNVVGAYQKLNAHSQCTINTISKMAAYNQIQSNNDQTSSVLGLLPGIFSGLAGIIVLVVIGVIVVSVIGAIGYLLYSVMGRKPTPPPGAAGAEGEQSLAQQLESGEIPPEELSRLEAGYQQSQAPGTETGITTAEGETALGSQAEPISATTVTVTE